MMLTFCLTLATGYGQVTWKRTYGGIGRDYAKSIKTLPDGGAIVCGSTGSFGTTGGDIYVFRVDINGVRLWSRVLGGDGIETGEAVVLTEDAGSLIVGSTNSMGAGGYDGFIVRLDENGNTLWQRTYGTPDWDFLYAGAAHSGGFMLAGQSFGVDDPSGDLWLVRVDDEGGMEWMHGYGGPGADEARSVLDLGTEGCVLGGTVNIGSADQDAVLVRIAVNGDEQWLTPLGDENDQMGYGSSTVASGGFLVTGYAGNEDAVRRMFLAKTDASGTEMWTRDVSSAGNDWEARSVLELPNGNIMVAGYTKEYGAGDRDVSILQLTPTGDFIDGPTYGGAGVDEAWSIDVTQDGGFYLAGSSTSYGPGQESVFIVRSDGDTLNGPVVVYSDPVSVPGFSSVFECSVFPIPTGSGSFVTVSGSVGCFSATIVDVRGASVDVGSDCGGMVRIPRLQPGLFDLRIRYTDGRHCRSRLVIDE